MSARTKSNQPEIAFLDSGYASFEYEQRLFESNGYRFRVFPGDKGDLEGKLAFAAQAVGLLIRWTGVDDAMLARLPLLKAIVRCGTGYDNIDLQAAKRAGVRVANVQGYARHSVSNHALALMFACARGLPSGQRGIRTKFGAAPFNRIFDFHTKTLGIVGLGHIGGALCAKTTPLFKSVLATDPYITAERFAHCGAVPVAMEQLLAESDVISIHCNLTTETAGMIDSRAFESMAQRPILINTARGPIVEEGALFRALEEDRIHSAGIDVYNTEFPNELPERIISHPRVIATGHYAWYSEQAHVELQQRAADNLLAMLNGQHVADRLA